MYLLTRLKRTKISIINQKKDEAGMYLDKPNPKAFIEHSNTMDDVYNNFNDHNPKRCRKILIVFDDMIVDINTNKKFQAVVKELFFRCRKINVSLVFITQSYFSFLKEIRLNSTHCLITKIHSKKELQNIANNHLADIDYKDFMKICRKCTSESHFFLLLILITS